MGRTSQPLTIAVWEGFAVGSTPDRWLWPAVLEALLEKGHRVVALGELEGPPDLLLAPFAHRWEAKMFDKPMFLDEALKAAWARRYPRQPKETP